MIYSCFLGLIRQPTLLDVRSRLQIERDVSWLLAAAMATPRIARRSSTRVQPTKCTRSTTASQCPFRPLFRACALPPSRGARYDYVRAPFRRYVRMSAVRSAVLTAPNVSVQSRPKL